MLKKLFNTANKRAWAKIQSENDVQKLIIEERNQKVQNSTANQRTIDKILDINK